MYIIEKVKEHGILKSLTIFPKYLCIKIELCFFAFFSLLPIKKNWIGFESRGDLSDNAYALFEYMWSNGYEKKYTAIWYVTDSKSSNARLKKNGFNNVKLSSNRFDDMINLKKVYYLARAKYFIFDHDLLLKNYRKRKNQYVVYLSHGIGYKGSYSNSVLPPWVDMMTVTGSFTREGGSKFWNYPASKVFITGYPRNDYFFTTSGRCEKFIKEMGILHFSKVLFWMPTFRKSNFQSISQDYLNNETGLPLIDTFKKFKFLNDYLTSHDTLIVLKPHPLQADLPVFKEKLSNIMVLTDELLGENNVQLYELLTKTDGLITDYSSISQDYSMLNKPMIFTVDDFNMYKNSRGFLYGESTLDYLKGYHVTRMDELQMAINDIVEGRDIYKHERTEFNKLLNEYNDAFSSMRVLNHIPMLQISSDK